MKKYFDRISITQQDDSYNLKFYKNGYIKCDFTITNVIEDMSNVQIKGIIHDTSYLNAINVLLKNIVHAIICYDKSEIQSMLKEEFYIDVDHIY